MRERDLWDKEAPQWKNHESLGKAKQDVCGFIYHGIKPFLANLNRNDKIINLGSGSNMEDYFGGYDLSNAYCLDISRKMLRYNKVQNKIIADLCEKMPIADNEFALCVSFFLLRYIPREKYGVLLFEMQRILKPGGRFILIDVPKNRYPNQKSKVDAYGIGALCERLGFGEVLPQSIEREYAESIDNGFGGSDRTTSTYQMEVVYGQKYPIGANIQNNFVSNKTYQLHVPF